MIITILHVLCTFRKPALAGHLSDAAGGQSGGQWGGTAGSLWWTGRTRARLILTECLLRHF